MANPSNVHIGIVIATNLMFGDRPQTPAKQGGLQDPVDGRHKRNPIIHRLVTTGRRESRLFVNRPRPAGYVRISTFRIR